MTTFKKQVEVQGTKKLDSIRGIQELKLDEMKEIQGGASILRLTGILDGIRGNTHLYFFKWRIF